jgi:hypothetical protein
VATPSRRKTIRARRKATKNKRSPVSPKEPTKAPRKPSPCVAPKTTAAQRKKTRSLTAKQRKAARRREAARKKACAKERASRTGSKTPPARPPAAPAATAVAGGVPTSAPAPQAPVGTPAPLPAPPVLVVPDVPPVTAPRPSPPAAADHPDPAGPLTLAGAYRLLWRAGFGPRPGEPQELVDRGLDAVVQELVHPSGPARLEGPEPTDDTGQPLMPADRWGHAHSWWLDRMVRSTQPLVERMTLVWHDWFAISLDKVDGIHAVNQNELLRRRALGSFRDLLRDVTVDPAMLVWLDGILNNRWHSNENHARELMELYTLGANRGAYDERDVREAARALTGWRADWLEGVGMTGFRYDPTWHDAGTKTVFGQAGAFDWEDVCRLCLDHPLHPSFLVTKLWSAFVPIAPDQRTVSYLQDVYTGSGFEIAPVVAAILRHRVFYEGPAMVVPPAVQQAGILRTIGRRVDSANWGWFGSRAGQHLFYAPSVAGWDEGAWLDTSTWKGRWETVSVMLHPFWIDPWSATEPYSTTETAEDALATALRFCGDPPLTPEVHATLAEFAVASVPEGLPSWEHGPRRAQRQNALRTLILTSSDVTAP